MLAKFASLSCLVTLNLLCFIAVDFVPKMPIVRLLFSLSKHELAHVHEEEGLCRPLHILQREVSVQVRLDKATVR